MKINPSTLEPTIKNRSESIALLKKLLLPSRQGIESLRRLILRTEDVGLKEIRVRHWQQLARCAAELENKVRELGGQVQDVPEDPITLFSPQGPLIESLPDEKTLLLNALNQEAYVHTLYSEALGQPISFDMKMLLQRHRLQIHDIAARVSVEHAPQAPSNVLTSAY